MALATITFWEQSFNQHGIPNTFHSYLVSVFVNHIINRGDKIVKIVPLTLDSPKSFSERPFIVKNSTKEMAINEAFNMLKEVPELNELECCKNNLKTEEKSPKLVSNW